MTDPIERLRRMCLDLPAVSEKVSHGEVAFFVQLSPKSSRQFVAVDDHHHGSDRLAMWCPAPPGVQDELIAANSAQYFRPPYVGHRGWVGVRLDLEPDWYEIAEVVTDAYRQVASAKQIGCLDERLAATESRDRRSTK